MSSSSSQVAKKAQELASQLLGINSGSQGSSVVDGVMGSGGHFGCGSKFGGGVDTVKMFYANHKTGVRVGGAVVGVVLIGLIGYGVYDKFMANKNDKVSHMPQGQDD